MSNTQYATPQALVDEFGERELIALTDVATPRSNEVDFAVAQRACDRVNAEVAAAVSARYRLPLSSTPELLKYLALDLAHFYLYQTEPASWIQVRFDAARKQLRDIQTGALPLGVDQAGTPAVDVPQNLAEFTTGGKVFGRESL